MTQRHLFSPVEPAERSPSRRAAVRERLDRALSAAKRLGVESFDLPDEPGQIVIHWREGLDDEPRARLDAALVAVEAANARARFESIRASHPHLTVETPCPDPAPPVASAASPSADGAPAAPLETGGDCAAPAISGAGRTCSDLTGTTSPASTATTELEHRAAVHRLLVEQAVDAGHMELAEARRTGADAGRIAAITAGVHGMQQYLADRWIPAWSPEPSDEDALALLKVNAAVDVVGRQHRLDAAVGRERLALARAEAAEREAAQLRIRADQVAVLEADLVKAHERADKAEADKRWAIASSTQAVSESVTFAQHQIDALTAERDAAQARSESFRRTLAGTANDLALALGIADQGLAWAELVALVRSRAANLEREVKRLTAHLEIADEQLEAVRKMERASYQQLEARRVEEIERLRAQACALAADRDRAVKLALDCALAPVEALPVAPTEREPRWLAAVRERLGAESDEDVAFDAGPYVQAADVRRERERLGIPEYVAP